MTFRIKLLTTILLSLIFGATAATTDLADQPLATSITAPGNLALTLSVEYPTAVSVAYTNRTYSPSTEYQGYFDPTKCYSYRYSSADTTTSPSTTNPDSYFYPVSFAGTTGGVSSHVCSSNWSGNFLNWASTQTIDAFRSVLTGGYRVIDSSTLSVVEKAWASGQGGTGNFPDSVITGGATIAGATPFPATTTTLGVRIQGLGNVMRFGVSGNTVSFVGKYYNNQNFNGTPALTRTDPSINFDWNNVAPAPGVNRTNMSVRWTGTATALTTGSYTFQGIADDTIVVTVDGNQVINQPNYNTATNSTPITAAAGHVFNIQVDFTQGGGGSFVNLNWQTPGSSSFVAIGGPPSLYTSTPTAYNPTAGLSGDIAYDAFARAKVCDSTLLETSGCTAYGINYKPEGLIQQYANKIRFAVFGYLNDGAALRDGGVLRAKMKFVGPQQPNPGLPATTNASAEWSGSTGIFTNNPNSADATGTGNGAVDSGVSNYLNKFGKTAKSYKTFDPVSELYYSAIRYFKNQGNVPEYTSNLNNGYVDGFPVITAWDDPIQYSCQRNYILGIGDVNTHYDSNLPGTMPIASGTEPTKPSSVTSDTTVDVKAAADKIGNLEAASSDPSLPSWLGSSNLGSVKIGTLWCCDNPSDNGFGMAGLAYDSHTKDMRPTDFTNSNGTKSNIQTVSTYWVDVLEGQVFRPYNQFWMAAKFGGFTVPPGYAPYTNATAIPSTAWDTNNDLISTDGSVSTAGTYPRPDHYYTGNSPAAIRTGLTAAFADIGSTISASTTSFTTSSPQVQQSNNISYGASYDAQSWTGNLVASSVSFDATGTPTLVQQWNARDKLTAQAAVVGNVKGWDTRRLIATSSGLATATATGVSSASGVPFRLANLSTTEQASLVLTNTTIGTPQLLLNYLRGDTSNEGSSGIYRSRSYLLGDIVDSRVVPVAAPNATYSDSSNPGYASFKSSRSSRPTVVYVGANDGMMHAFNGAITGSTQGNELFAYIPSFAIYGPTATPPVNGMASLANTSFVHHNLVDATPAVYDIDFGKAGTATAGAVDWHSVLIGGLGKGGKGFYAIDVTSPESITNETTLASKVLWEFSDAKMGYSFGPPVVAKTAKYGWVVILTSGYNNLDGNGYLFILNPKTGALLEPPISTGAGTAANPSGLTFASAYIVDYSDFTAESVYAGDLLGNLWRFDLTSTNAATNYPAPIKIASFTNAAGTAQPVTSRPVVEIDPKTLIRYVAVGTGQLLGTTDFSTSSLQSFYAIKDGTRTSFSTSGTSFPVSRSSSSPGLTNNTSSLLTGIASSNSLGWYVDLGISSTGVAQRVVTDGTANSGTVAFAAVQSNGDPCNPLGSSQIFALSLGSGKTVLVQGTTAIASVLTPGFTTDLSFVNVAGRIRLEAGNDQGLVTNITGNFDAITGSKRLNWREVPLTN